MSSQTFSPFGIMHKKAMMLTQVIIPVTEGRFVKVLDIVATVFLVSLLVRHSAAIHSARYNPYYVAQESGYDQWQCRRMAKCKA